MRVTVRGAPLAYRYKQYPYHKQDNYIRYLSFRGRLERPMPPSPSSRRHVLRLAGASATALAAANLTRALPILRGPEDPLETIRIGIVGVGNRGQDHMWALGFPPRDPTYQQRKNKLLDPIANVQVVAACDVFDEHLDAACAAIEGRGLKPLRYVDYRKMLDEAKLDAVVIATPDHMHAPIATAAAEAGCDVYVEKCMTNSLDEIAVLGKALGEHKRVLQVGYQLHQDQMHQLAREIIARGTLGEVHSVQTYMNRSGPTAGWNSPRVKNPPPASAIHWNEFLGVAPKRDYDPARFFEWRRYWDYSTGISGDLFSHVLSAVQFVLGLGMPGAVTASGGVYHWRDGRETPDTYSTLLEFPSERTSLSFNCTLSNSFFKRSSMTFFGTEANLELSWNVRVYPERLSVRYASELKSGKYAPEQPFIDISDSAAGAVVQSAPSSLWLEGRGATLTTGKDGKVRDTTRLHHEEWVACMRARTQPSASFENSLVSTVGSHLGTRSYREGRTFRWQDGAAQPAGADGASPH